MPTVVVQYRCAPDHADENQRLVAEVFAALADTGPDGLRYTTLRLEDDTFVHIADVAGDNPLAEVDAFARFQQDLPARCLDGHGPNPRAATLVGSYRFDLISET